MEVFCYATRGHVLYGTEDPGVVEPIGQVEPHGEGTPSLEHGTPESVLASLLELAGRAFEAWEPVFNLVVPPRLLTSFESFRRQIIHGRVLGEPRVVHDALSNMHLHVK